MWHLGGRDNRVAETTKGNCAAESPSLKRRLTREQPKSNLLLTAGFAWVPNLVNLCSNSLDTF